ncbi:MAG: sulfurtransferase complex subunit TusC [Pseudohongiellaceae bacterium]
MTHEPDGITFITRHAPYGTDAAAACLDLVLAFSVFAQQVNYLFYEDGVFQLLKDQHGAAANCKTLSAGLEALELYGVKNVLVHEESMRVRGLASGDFVLAVQLIDSQRLRQLVQTSKCVFSL